jgi:hypothetical protein
VSGLAAGPFTGRLFDDGFGSLGRIGGGRQGGVGGVVPKLFLEGLQPLLQGDEALLQTSDDLVTLPTSGTGRFVQARIL